jgi:cytochrome c553
MKTFLFPALIAAAGAVFAEDGGNGRSPGMLGRPCLACHSEARRESNGFPYLPGMPKRQFLAKMRRFRDVPRAGSIMARIAKGYRDEDLLRLSEYFLNIHQRHPR